MFNVLHAARLSVKNPRVIIKLLMWISRRLQDDAIPECEKQNLVVNKISLLIKRSRYENSVSN